MADARARPRHGPLDHRARRRGGEREPGRDAHLRDGGGSHRHREAKGCHAGAARGPALRERPRRRPADARPRQRRVGARRLPRAAPARGGHALHGVGRRTARRTDAAQQRAVRARLAGGSCPQGPDGRRRAGLRAQLPQAKLGSGPRRPARLGRAQGTERSGTRHVVRAGGRRSRRGPGGRLPDSARGVVRVRRARPRELRGGVAFARPARDARQLRHEPRGRPARGRRPILRAARRGGHAARAAASTGRGSAHRHGGLEWCGARRSRGPDGRRPGTPHPARGRERSRHRAHPGWRAGRASVVSGPAPRCSR